MARIRVLKVRGKVNNNKPKTVNFHSDNFDRYTKQKSGKYNIIVIDNTQKDKFLNNQLKAYSAKVRLHA